MTYHDYDILNTLSDGAVVIDREYTLVFANRAAAAFYGLQPAGLTGAKCHEIFYRRSLPCDEQFLDGGHCGVAAVLATGRPMTGMHRHATADGVRRIFEVTSSPITDENGKVDRIIQIRKDVTECKETEEALRSSEARYRTLFEESPVPLFVADLSAVKEHLDALRAKGLVNLSAYFSDHPEKAAACLDLLKIVDFNKAILTMFEVETKELRKKNLDKLLARIPLHETPEGLCAISEGRSSFAHEIKTHTLGGRRLYNILRWTVEPGFEHTYGRVLLSLVDITARREAEERLRTLTRRLSEAEEAERRRLARELHDEVGQKITALGINLQILGNDARLAEADRLRRRMDDSVALVEDMAEQLRLVMADLRPPVLDDYGLPASLRWLGSKVADRTGLRIMVEALDSMPRLREDKEIALYRIVQEAMTNAVKHARAGRLDISLLQAGNRVRLVIMDDGRGFDPQRARPAHDPERWGLLGMRERSEALGGLFKLETRPGAGVKITVEIPL